MDLTPEQAGMRNAYQRAFNELFPKENNLQNVFTPYELGEKVIDKLSYYSGIVGKKWLTLNLEFVILLIERGVVPSDICFLTDCELKADFGKEILGVEVMQEMCFDFIEDMDKKRAVRTWDCVIMNPPYQTKSDKDNKKTQPIWDKFVEVANKVVVKGGMIAAIHPSGWRNVDGIFSDTKKILQGKQIHHLSINNLSDGMKTFGCATRYDWYVMTNEKADASFGTEIDCEDGKNVKVSIGKMPFIPNYNFDRIFSLMANTTDKKVELLYSRSSYGSDKPNMASEQTEKFPHPCIQHVSVKGEPSCTWYSSTKDNGHFGVPKVIFSSRQVGGTMVDEDGKYGMCQDCSAIISPKKDLEKIKKAMDSKDFIELMKTCDFGGNSDRYPRKIMETFRADFWKEFI